MSPRRLGIFAVLFLAALSGLVAVSANTPQPVQAASGVCQPELSAVWGVEAEPLHVPIVCGTGHVPAPGELELIDPPPGATLDAAAREVVWTPGLDQAATYDLEVRVGDEQGSVVVGIGDAWNDPDNVPPLEPTLLTDESGLGVFHIVTDASVSADQYRDAEVTYRGHRYVGTAAKLRGSLSLAYDKDNFTLRFDSADPFADPSLPGLDGSLKLVLNGDFDDNSHLRNRLAFDLWNEMGADHLRVDTASAVVYVNGAYEGLYTVTDQVGEEFLSDAGLDGGELYKAIGHRADFTASDGSLAAHDLEQKAPDPEEMVVSEPAVLDLYDFVDRSNSVTFRTDVADRLVLGDFVDWLVLVSLIGAGDSTAKNAYVYAPADGGPFRALPWDFNQSYGQDFQTARLAPDTLMPSEIVERNRLFERLLDDPELAAMVVDRVREVLGGVGSAEALQARVAGLRREIGPAALRDEERWDKTYRESSPWADRTDFTTFDEELDELVDWYESRVPEVAAAFEEIDP